MIYRNISTSFRGRLKFRQQKCLICPLGFWIPHYIKITIPKINLFFYPPPLSISNFLFSPSSSLSSILTPFRLHLVFLPIPPSPSLSHFSTFFPQALNYLSLLIAHSVPSFVSFHPMSVFSLLVPTSKSRYHFSFSSQILRNFLCHTPLKLPVVHTGVPKMAY
jgi:hypothetical protein